MFFKTPISCKKSLPRTIENLRLAVNPDTCIINTHFAEIRQQNLHTFTLLNLYGYTGTYVIDCVLNYIFCKVNSALRHCRRLSD